MVEVLSTVADSKVNKKFPLISGSFPQIFHDSVQIKQIMHALSSFWSSIYPCNSILNTENKTSSGLNICQLKKQQQRYPFGCPHVLLSDIIAALQQEVG